MMREVVAGDDLGDWITDYNPDALLADGFDQAILGICEIHGSPPVVAYDRELCIQILTAQFSQSGEAAEIYQTLDGSRTEAEEFFEFNVAGAYMGAHTPAFITVRRTPDGN
jgi:hypothetical protein